MRACGVALLLATGALPHWAALSTTLRPELPPELPLPSVPAAPAVLSWLRSATVVQIQGCELNLLVQNTSAAAAWRALGFDTVVFDPPGMHNVYFPQQAAVSEAEFEQVLGHFKAAGFKILFYTSLTNLGHSPLWQNGTLAREHPEWAMRDAAGAPQHSSNLASVIFHSIQKNNPSSLGRQHRQHLWEPVAVSVFRRCCERKHCLH